MSCLARNLDVTGAPFPSDIAIPLAIQTSPQVCAQVKLNDEFWLGEGEWFIDTTQGVPYIQSRTGRPILGVKQPSIVATRALFRKIILATPGIVAVQELQVTYNPGARTFDYAFKAVDNTGAIISGGNTPFVTGGVGSP
jgi:hypothetical protein